MYAKAGIQHFWRVEEVNGLAVVYGYESDRTKYALSGIFHDRLKLSVPFEIDIDLNG